MQRPPPSRPHPSSGLRRSAEIFRAQIEEALADGAKVKDLTLHLTLSDASELKRDRLLAVEDISFSKGVMRFLGVTVEQGGVTASSLERSGKASSAA